MSCLHSVQKSKPNVFTITLKILNKFPSYLTCCVSSTAQYSDTKIIHFTSHTYAHYLVKLLE